MNQDTAREYLKIYFGHEAFRPGQEELIDAILSGRDVLGVMPTGAGKSICYQLPALMRSGITLVVSPLISLMKDQVAALKEAGVSAAYINSTLTAAQQREALRRAESGAYKLIYVAPERLLVPSFLRFAAGQEISLLAVDEAHCVSQWGQDFRPNYLDIPAFLRALPERPPLAAFTATATDEVREDIIRLLTLQSPFCRTTGFDRPNLFYAVRRERDRTDWLKRYLRGQTGRSGIVYCATRKTVERLCQQLTAAGFAATRYHAGLDDDERRRNQEDFACDRATVMVATNAFGMGIDKSNVSFVIHYNMPKNIESYYQEAGRAGRDGAPADCILLYSPGDVITAKFLINNGNDRDQVPEELREGLLARDMLRLRQMENYCKTDGCLRAALLRYFGEESGEHCGNCGNCVRQAEETDDMLEEDITVPAQKILSCVRRVELQNRVGLGATTVVRILCGSEDKRIIQSGYDRLTTYGLLKGTNRKRIREYIDALLRQGYLVEAKGDYQTLTTTSRADHVLFDGERVFWRHRQEKDAQPDTVKPVRPSSQGGQNRELFERLRTLRAELARKAGLPAYVVFHDATLLAMADSQPDSREALLAVSGVGEKKAEKYGKVFLECIRQWKAEQEQP